MFSGRTDAGESLDAAQCRRLMDLAGTEGAITRAPEAVSVLLNGDRMEAERPILEALGRRNGDWFDTEVDKLDRWTEDRKDSLKAELEELDDRVKELKRAARSAPTLPEKLERQRDVKKLEVRRDEAWREYDRASRELERRKEELLDEVQRRMLTYVDRNQLFTVRWRLA